MKKAILLIAFAAYTMLGSAQGKPYYESYDWIKNPSYPTDKVDDKEIVGLKNNVVSEFYFESKNSLVEYYLEHEVLFLNSDKQIENYNKVYLPYSDRSEIMRHKARVINKDGSIVEVGSDKIFDATDEETGRKYQYFALEGLEKGSVLERMYVYKRSPEYNGKYLRLQEDYDKYDVSFNLFAPENLVFKFKSYNGLPTAQEIDIAGVNHWRITSDFIEGIDKEEGASYDSNTQHLVYKLYSNRSNATATFADYATAAKNIDNNLRPELSKRDGKAVDAFAKKAIQGSSQEEKLRTLDNYIKENIFKATGNDDKYEDVKSIINGNIGNNSGIIKLYLAVLDNSKIPYELVLTTSREDTKFDPTFEAYNFLQEYLIYFPETDKYTSPTDFSTRYGFPNGYYTDNYGLFIKQVKVGDYVSSVAEVKYIDAVKAKDTKDLMQIDVTFDDEDPSAILFDLHNELTGYSASYIQTFFFRMDEDNRERLMTSYAQRLTEDMEILEKEAKNVEKGIFGKEPLIMDYVIKSNDFIEKAGNKRLFKIGKLIGRQTELYQEKERKLPFDNVNNRIYDRTITVQLPDGVTIANLEDLQTDNQFKNKNGETVFFFKSDYTLEGNLLTVTADEFYDQNVVLPANYEEYRTVINSAADFEKVTLILQNN